MRGRSLHTSKTFTEANEENKEPSFSSFPSVQYLETLPRLRLEGGALVFGGHGCGGDPSIRRKLLQKRAKRRKNVRFLRFLLFNIWKLYFDCGLKTANWFLEAMDAGAILTYVENFYRSKRREQRTFVFFVSFCSISGNVTSTAA